MYIGIDIGGTKIAAGLVTREGELRYKEETVTNSSEGFDRVYKQIQDLVRSLYQHQMNAEQSEDIVAIGIGIPGITNPHTGDVKRCINLDWDEVPLKVRLEQDFSLPVSLANDATVAGMAEFVVGQSNLYQDAILLTLGTGIGASIMQSGNILLGSHGIASEIGHMIVGENFYNCNCGRNGCLETFSSSRGIIAYTQMRLDQGATSLLRQNISRKNPLNGRMIFEAALGGDSLAKEVIQRMVHYLALGMINLVTVLDPEIILIGGGLSGAGDQFLQDLISEFEGLKYYQGVSLPKVEIAKLKNDAGIIGAAMYAKWKS